MTELKKYGIPEQPQDGDLLDQWRDSNKAEFDKLAVKQLKKTPESTGDGDSASGGGSTSIVYPDDYDQLRTIFGHKAGEGRKLPGEFTEEDEQRSKDGMEYIEARQQHEAVEKAQRVVQGGQSTSAQDREKRREDLKGERLPGATTEATRAQDGDLLDQWRDSNKSDFAALEDEARRAEALRPTRGRTRELGLSL